MSLVLSEAEQARIAATARTLLSPLDVPIDQWRADVLDCLTNLFGADAGGFMLPVGDGVSYTLRSLPDEFAQEYLETHDTSRSIAMLRALSGGAWSIRMLARLLAESKLDEFRDDPMFRSFRDRYRFRDAIGYAITSDPPSQGAAAANRTPSGALLICFHERGGTDAFGDHGLDILRLLTPALEAGVAGRMRDYRMRGALQVLFDDARDGLMVCNAQGRRLFANDALAEILEAEPEAALLLAAIERARRLPTTLIHADRPADVIGDVQDADSEVRTAQGRYRIRVHLAGGELFEAGPNVVISVQRLTPQLPSTQQLLRCWGLTHQEARVAQLLARGLTNAKIGATLKLRSSTARHYTEAVFSKLGTRSRAEVAYKILVN
jgi:DNA-binding CsgD family transcriptional regulator